MWFLNSMRGAKKRIYLDNASSTLPLVEALRATHEAEKLVGNPGAIHFEAVEAKRVLTDAREKVAKQLACKAREVLFTSGLTESNNLATLGVARKLQMQGTDLSNTHWIVSSIEHSSVLECFAEIERLGGSITHIDPDARGIISPEEVVRALRSETVLISIGWANNEIGVIQPLRDITRLVREKQPTVLMHSDAGQAPLSIPPQVHTLDVDLLSLGSNKLYGPHGVGALYIGKRVELAGIILGGSQERNLRAGTENVALAAGFAEAMYRIGIERQSEARRIRILRDKLMRGLLAAAPDALVNGDSERAIPHMLNISVPNIQSEYLTLALDRLGVAISTKSACEEGEESFSHVVRELPGPNWRAENTLRFSLGRETNDADIARTCEHFKKILAQIRT